MVEKLKPVNGNWYWYDVFWERTGRGWKKRYKYLRPASHRGFDKAVGGFLSLGLRVAFGNTRPPSFEKMMVNIIAPPSPWDKTRSLMSDEEWARYMDRQRYVFNHIPSHAIAQEHARRDLPDLLDRMKEEERQEEENKEIMRSIAELVTYLPLGTHHAYHPASRNEGEAKIELSHATTHLMYAQYSANPAVVQNAHERYQTALTNYETYQVTPSVAPVSTETETEQAKAVPSAVAPEPAPEPAEEPSDTIDTFPDAPGDVAAEQDPQGDLSPDVSGETASESEL